MNAGELSWEQAFPTAKAPERVYFKASYRDERGAEHRLESWRNGTRFLHRSTDGRIDLFLSGQPGPAAYRYRIVDHARRSVIDVERNNLYRIGVFADWPVLAHVLDRPHMGQHILAIELPRADALAPCRWRAVSRAEAPEWRDEVCWSALWALPLVIRRAGPGAEPIDQFRITELRRARADETRQLPLLPAGYKYIDANRDIAPDGD